MASHLSTDEFDLAIAPGLPQASAFFVVKEVGCRSRERINLPHVKTAIIKGD
jgi:hypothetical protein